MGQDQIEIVKTLGDKFIRKKHTEEMQIKQLVFPKTEYIDSSIYTSSTRNNDSKRPITAAVNTKSQRRQ